MEGGYSYGKGNLFGRVNAYYSVWNDRSFLANEYNQFLDPVLIKGLNARHSGIEAEANYILPGRVRAGLFAGVGNWIWTNDVEAEVYNSEHVIVDTINVYTENLYVGDAPMTQVGGFAEVSLFRFLTLRGEATHYDRIFAGFDPVSRSNPDDRSQAWEIPSYTLVDIHLTGNFTMFHQPAMFNISVLNLFDADYILRGVDGMNHTANTFTGFAGFGRTFSVGMRVEL